MSLTTIAIIAKTRQTYNTQFSGPGGGSLGQVGSYMYGYWPTSHEYFENCLWQRFFSNLLIAYDHQTFFRCSISQSYYACDFADNPITKGNQNFLERSEERRVGKECRS